VVEQGTHKPLAVGSNPTLATKPLYMVQTTPLTPTPGGEKGVVCYERFYL
jgi:hypothetical protein